MLILAVDTTGREGGFALWRDGGILASTRVSAERGFGAAIFPRLAELLASEGLGFSDVDGYAAASGPGSFTGIRVGLTAVKALAEAHGKKVATAPNLLAMAWAGEGDVRAPVLDGRRKEVFAALYDNRLNPLVEQRATRWGDFLEAVGDRDAVFLGVTEEVFSPSGAAPTPPGDKRERMIVSPLAEAVASLGAESFRRGEALAPEEVDANYVRRPDAERNWKGP